MQMMQSCVPLDKFFSGTTLRKHAEQHSCSVWRCLSMTIKMTVVLIALSSMPLLPMRWHRKQLASLQFLVDGEDLTGADARLTQMAIERRLAVSLLSRAAFHGQADITSLLEVPAPVCRADQGIKCSFWCANRLLLRSHQHHRFLF